MVFTDKKPLFSYTSDCDDCELSKTLISRFKNKQLLFFLIVFSTIFLAGNAIFVFNRLFLIPWIVMIVFYFVFVQPRVICSHCPRYSNPDSKLMICWGTIGSPKIWEYRPGPLALWEKMVFYSGFIIIALYPIVFFILGNNYLFLGLYCILLFIGKQVLHRYYCSCCINFACPLNATSQKIRTRFFDKNPVLHDARKRKTN